MADEVVQEQVKTDFKPTGWQLRSEIETELRAQLRVEYETLFGLWKTGELDSVRKESEQIAKDGIQKLFDKWKEEQKPPTDDEIQVLLNQEYAEFTIPVRSKGSDGKVRDEVFTIGELPQAAEVKFYKIFVNKVMKNTQALQAFTQEGIDKPFEERVKSFLSLFDEFPELMADSVVVILNPFTERKDLDRDWVQNNISSNRQWNIIEAQIKVNRLKDFFSRLSQSGQQTQTMLGGLNFQQLQQLAR